MKHFLLIYTFAPDYIERRAQFRNEHLRLAWEAHDSGSLLLGGALADPPDRGVMLFQAEDPVTVEAFARRDPYVVNGLATSWEVRPWTTVIGATAATPVIPELT